MSGTHENTVLTHKEWSRGGSSVFVYPGSKLQITAPNGLGLFHGRDRKALWLGFVLGLITAVGTIIFQDQTLLF
jgi:hypothetical protein